MIAKIGNSRGVRILKLLSNRLILEKHRINLRLALNENLLLKPIFSKPRKDWEQKIKKMATTHSNQKDKGQLDDFLNHEDDIKNWQW